MKIPAVLIKSSRKWCLFLLTACLCYAILHIDYFLRDTSNKPPSNENNEPFIYVYEEALVIPNKTSTMKPKLIVLYSAPGTEAFGQHNLAGCPDYNCIFSTDSSKAKDADAIITHMHGFSPNSLNFKRRPEQSLVFFDQESPANFQVQPYPKHFFNLSLSFKTDSDIPCPYGYIIKRRRQRPPLVPSATSNTTNLDTDALSYTPTAFIPSKKHLAAWTVSNCNTQSRREVLVKALQKHVEIHVYGSCGTFRNCPKTMDDSCFDTLAKDYYFYFAFENSICADYVTEKFWRTLVRNIVPVVLHRGTVAKLVPPSAFIAADDFSSVAAFASHLAYLKSHHEAYAAYFDWKRTYRPVFLDGRTHGVHERPWGFCELCRRIQQQSDGVDRRDIWGNQLRSKTTSIRDAAAWWNTRCDTGQVVSKILAGDSSNSTGYHKSTGK